MTSHSCTVVDGLQTEAMATGIDIGVTEERVALSAVAPPGTKFVYATRGARSLRFAAQTTSTTTPPMTSHTDFSNVITAVGTSV